MVVASQGTQLVKLKDVARVELGPEDDRSIFRWKGTPSVAIGVVRQSKANLIDVAKRIRAELPAIQRPFQMPWGEAESQYLDKVLAASR